MGYKLSVEEAMEEALSNLPSGAELVEKIKKKLKDATPVEYNPECGAGMPCIIEDRSLPPGYVREVSCFGEYVGLKKVWKG